MPLSSSAFGEIHPYKRVLPALAAFAQYHTRNANSLLILIGRTSPLFDVTDAARQLRVPEAVRIVGYAPRADYEAYIAAADVCLNLRYPTAGETSASLLRLLGAGKVTFVTRAGTSAELPDEVCVKIEPDAYEESLLFAYLSYFAQHRERTRGTGSNARHSSRRVIPCRTQRTRISEFCAPFRMAVRRRNRTSSRFPAAPLAPRPFAGRKCAYNISCYQHSSPPFTCGRLARRTGTQLQRTGAERRE